MDDEIWEALSQDSDYVPIFRFKEPGDEIEGDLVGAPKTEPLTEYKSDKPKLDSDGKQVMQVVLVLATEQREDDTDDGQRRVYLDKPLQRAAVMRALKDAGVRRFEDGGHFWMKFTGYRQMGGGSAYDFDAKYTVPQRSGGPIGDGVLGETGSGEEVGPATDDEPPF
jgi:hypothetical protein